MKPDVNQHLQSMAKALTEIVLPELQDKPFALEQASLIAASLQLLVEVQEHQFAYVRQEFDDIRSLLAAWFNAYPQSADPAFWQALEAVHNSSDAMGFGELRDTVSRAKSRLRTLMDGFPLPAASPVKPLLERYVERQLARETSWLRLTGFIPDAASIPEIGTVLETQHKTPL